MTVSRKRPLLSSSKAPPPVSETTRRLEKIIDGRKPAPKKVKKTLGGDLKSRNLDLVSTSNNRFSHFLSSGGSTINRTSGIQSTPKPSISYPSPSSLRNRNVLAPTGGLASASTFRKSKPSKSPGGIISKEKITQQNSKVRNPSSVGKATSLSVGKDESKQQQQQRPRNIIAKIIHKTPEVHSLVDRSTVDALKSQSSTKTLQSQSHVTTNPAVIQLLPNKKPVLTPLAKPIDVSTDTTQLDKNMPCNQTSTPETFSVAPKITAEDTSMGEICQSNPPVDICVKPTTPDTSAINMPIKINIGRQKRKIVLETKMRPRESTANLEVMFKIPTLDLPTSKNEPSIAAKDTLQNATETDNLLQRKISVVDDNNNPVKAVVGTTQTAGRKRSAVNNDNFVRQNLRNSAGACRGARNKKRFKGGRRFNQNHNIDQDEAERRKEQKKYTTSQTASQYTCRMTGLDPLDEFLDGAFHKKTSVSKGADNEIPVCARHQRPCKLLTVKKNTSGNKGRKFYACSMPRGEQCDHFQWVEDSIEAARATISKNSSNSGFITRQVTAHVNRFRPLTVPEIREELAKRNLNNNGKKQQLLMRLAIWTRDEVAKTCKEENAEAQVTVVDDEKADGIILESDDSDEEDEDSVDSDELEISENETSEDVPETKNNIVEQSDNQNHCGGRQNNEAMESTPLSILQCIFGHPGFRKGQEWAIERCLAKKRSVLVAPTGFGKSLCYALPAAMMDGICVVVSPLISLIEDQLRSLPPRIPAATLSGSITTAGMAAIVDDVIRKRIKILFVSPERMASASFRRLFRPRWNPETEKSERRFPSISLLCVDEAHCMSQWAHNFRPCFLRFKGLLTLMNPESVLAITATAGPRVLDDICDTLDIGPFEKVGGEESNRIKNENVKVITKSRDNIDVACKFVSDDGERLAILAKILKSKSSDHSESSQSCQFSGLMEKGSIIVYVWRQKDTEVVAEYLNSSGVRGGVVVYHGGMDATARSTAQSRFMRGKARICVATVAFGLGIDKADVEGIVHMYVSNSPEHYLQEIGRAGRDGRYARALALPVVDEIPLRHSLAHSNLISKSQIRSLFCAVREQVQHTIRNLPNGRNVARPLCIGLPIQSSVIGCDCKVETLDTLLSLIEKKGGNDPLLCVEGFNYDRVTLAMKKRKLDKLAVKEDVAKSIMCIGECLDPPVGEIREEFSPDERRDVPTSTFQRQFLAYSLGSYTFSVARCASHMGPLAEPRHVFAALKRLQSSNELEFSLDTTDAGRVLHVKISESGMAFFSDENFETIVSGLVEELHEAVCSSIVSGADKVLDMHLIMQEVASCNDESTTDLFQKTEKSVGLLRFQELVTEYFSNGFEERHESENAKKYLPASFSSYKPQLLENDVLSIFRDLPVLTKKASDGWEDLMIGEPKTVDYTALAIAKFLHGIDSPRAPATLCRGHSLFGKWKHVRFFPILENIRSILISKPPTVI